jgi:hypothetical protein
MAESLTFLANGEAPREPQDRNIGETLKVIPNELLEEGIRRLMEGRYSHFAD